MKLIVGLGNPGKKYEGTRHNVGFDVLYELTRRHISERPKARFSGETVEGVIGGEKVLLLTPLTYMNESGRSVLAARDFFKLADDDLLVICDDFQLPLGKLRVRKGGSSGGQKGLADCIAKLGTEAFPRLRLGIGPVPPRWEVVDFVLGRFEPERQDEVRTMVSRGADAVETWVVSGVTEAANRFNGG